MSTQGMSWLLIHLAMLLKIRGDVFSKFFPPSSPFPMFNMAPGIW